MPEGEAMPSAKPAPAKVADTLGPIAGIAPAQATRSGDDVRRRGWFWHWNSIVTQYAPLIGLKGVGLINSYTVWTDRREESPHRGYAFPSQQREADFYGEDRAELITINKILVALDLIEIRKEMVLRTDGQGRRWRVPHNFYRVKDHNDGFHLTTEHVLKVIELADRDKTVYRYIRRIFSERFAPIDSDNVWARILPEVRQNETWQRLAARAAHEEDRASARTRAGHAARKANLGVPEDGADLTLVESQTPPGGGRWRGAPEEGNDSDNDTPPKEKTTSVAKINNGSAIDVEPGNKGSTRKSTTSVDPINRAGASTVAPINTTYDQDELVTTTTTTPVSERIDLTANADSGTKMASSKPTVAPASSGPGGLPAPIDAAGQAGAVQAFEDANGKRSTPAQRQMLTKLAADFEWAALHASHPGMETSWAWLTAAIYEAVEAGSAYVAPRRLREIMSRWEREGLRSRERRDPLRQSERSEESLRSQPLVRLGNSPDIALPHGFGSRRTWEFTIGLLSTTIERDRLAEFFDGTAISGYHDGEVTLTVPDATQAERIMGEYRELVARKLGEAMRRPIRLAMIAPNVDEASNDEPTEREATVATERNVSEDEVTIPSFLVPECGLPSGQVWAAVLDEIAHGGTVSRANLDTWLRQTALIGRAENGALIIGVPHALAQQRITTRLLSPLQAAVRSVVGTVPGIEVVVARDWLRAKHLPVSPRIEGDEAVG
jgi:hypothetical protein